MDVDLLVENPRNPNIHTPQQIELIAKVVKYRGWRSPIVISKQSGFIVCGHGRLQAAKLLNARSVPVDIQEFKNDADEWAHMIADNKLAEASKLDNTILKDILEELDSGEFDMDVTGFDSMEIEKLMNQVHQEINEQELDELLDTENECPKCGYEW